MVFTLQYANKSSMHYGKADVNATGTGRPTLLHFQQDPPALLLLLLDWELSEQ